MATDLQLERRTTNELINRLGAALAELQERLLALQAEAVSELAAEGSWSAAFTERRIARVQEAIETARLELVGAAGADGLAAELAEEAYAVGMNTVDAALLEQGVVAIAADFEGLHVPVSRLIAQELTFAVDDMARVILRRQSDVFRAVQARAAIDGITVGETIHETVGRLVAEFELRGIPAFTDSLGREWGLERYSRMLARTVTANANRQASILRTREAGIDLVIVIGGEIDTTCETCAMLDGTILSLSGSDPQYMSLAEAESMSPPLGHPNCIHTYVAWVPESRPSEQEVREVAERTADEQGYVINEIRNLGDEIEAT